MHVWLCRICWGRSSLLLLHGAPCVEFRLHVHLALRVFNLLGAFFFCFMSCSLLFFSCLGSCLCPRSLTFVRF